MSILNEKSQDGVEVISSLEKVCYKGLVVICWGRSSGGVVRWGAEDGPSRAAAETPEGRGLKVLLISQVTLGYLWKLRPAWAT